MENPNPSAADGRRLLQIARAALGKLALGFLFAGVIFGTLPVTDAADAEPLYYIYRGQQRPLTLDPAHIAIHVRTNSPDQLPAGLTTRGFTVADVQSRPLSDWIVLRQSHVPATRAANSQGTASTQGQASAVHQLIRDLTTTGDPGIDFVSPVFRDSSGNPVLVTSRVLIGFKAGVSASTRARLQSTVGVGAFTEQYGYPQKDQERWQIRATDGFVVLAAANALAQSPDVAYAEPDLVVSGHHDLTPTDPSFSTSWALHNTGLSGGQVGFDLNAVPAWDTTVGSPSVIVVILDVGIQQDHPDINQITGRDFTSDANRNPTGGPNSANDNHGTWVAGCVSERINNGIGTCGLAPGARVASARVGTNVTSDGHFTLQFSWVVDALNWARTIGARVTNNSNSYSETSSAIDAAYTSTHDSGMVHFASAGNESMAVIDYPGSSPNVNAVASLNRNGLASYFTNYGQGIKFAAPGEEIFTTDRTGRASEPGDYAVVSGTSFASPYTAAVAALIISVHPDWTATQVEQQMQRTCRDLGTPGYDTTFGYGLPDAFKAVSTIAPPPTPTPTPTATPTPTPEPTSTATPSASTTPTATPTPSVSPTSSPTPPSQPVNPNNILVSIGAADYRLPIPTVNYVREFTPAGDPVQTIYFALNGPPYPFIDPRGVAVDKDGVVNVNNGTLIRYSPITNTFTDLAIPGWNFDSAPWYGGLAAYDHFIFAPDQHYYPGVPDFTGTIRIDTLTNESVHFDDNNTPLRINIGLDGKLYVFNGLMIRVFDPITLNKERDIQLSEPFNQSGLVGFVNSLAVDQNGRIYLCGGYNGTIWRLNSAGQVEASRMLNAASMNDIQVDATGRLIVSQFGGRILVGDTSLSSFHAFSATPELPPDTELPIFLAFGTPLTTALPSPIPITSKVPALTQYSVVRSEGAAMARGVTNAGLHCADCSTSIALPFEVTFYDERWPAGTNIQASTNGFLFLAGNGANAGTCIPAAGFDTVIAPEWGDFSTANPADGIFTAISGGAPFRSLTVEWRVRSPSGVYNNFAVVFYENRHHIDFVYGTAPTAGFATIGLQRRDAAAYALVTCAGDGKPAPIPGTKYSFAEISVQSLPLTRGVPNGGPSGPVATFTTTRSDAKAADFTANVLWDGINARIGQVTGGPGAGPYFISLGSVPIQPPLYVRITDLNNLHSEEWTSPSIMPQPSPSPSPPPAVTPTVVVSASAPSVVEGSSTQFLITCQSGPVAQPLNVQYTISGKALEGIDYTVEDGGQAFIPAGGSSAAVVLDALTDGVKERSEKVTLTLLPSSNYNLSRIKSQRKATISILNQ